MGPPPGRGLLVADCKRLRLILPVAVTGPEPERFLGKVRRWLPLDEDSLLDPTFSSAIILEMVGFSSRLGIGVGVVRARALPGLKLLTGADV